MAFVSDSALTYAAAAGTNVAANMPAHETGDLLIAFCVMNAGAMTTSSSGWTAISNNTTAGTTNTSSYTYKVAASAAETFTFTTTDDYSLIIVCVKDNDTTTPIDVFSHLGTATSTSQQTSVSVTTTTPDCLVLYFIGVDGVANSALSNPGVHSLTSMDNGGTTANTATTNAAAWYVQRTAGATPAAAWTCSLAGVAARLTVAVRNKSGGRIPAYVDDVSSPATVITPAHHYSTLNNVSWTNTLTATAAINGKTVTGTSGAAQADLGINPFSSGVAIAAATVARTTLSGYQISLTGNRNLSTGLLMGSHIGATPKMGTFGMGTVADGGVVIRIGSAAGNWCAYQVAAKDSVPNLEVRSVWAIEPGYTTTSYGTPGSAVNTAAVSFIQVLQNSPYFNSHAILSEVYQVFTQIVSGGDANFPVDSSGLAEVGRSFRLPVIQKAGGAGVISYAPIQIGGGDAVNFQIDAGALQFPRRYTASTKEIGYHASDNKVGISYAGKSGDVIKHTNSVITSLTPYYWNINASATSAATWDFTGLTIVNANVTLRNVMTFTEMSFSDCRSLIATGCTVSNSLIKLVATTANSMQVNGTSSIDGCSINTTRISAGVAMTQVANPSVFQNCTFTGSSTSGHAIEITAAGTYSFSGNVFTGYGAGGTNSAAIYNNSGGAVTLNVSGGGSVPTVRNGAGASTTVNAAADVTLTGLIADSEIRAYVGSTSDPAAATEIAGVESSTTSFTFSQSVAGQAGYIQIFHVLYQPVLISLTYAGTAQTIPVQQITDRQYARGSIFTPG